MTTYLDGCGGVEDESGVSFGHRDRAIRYARDVVHELMRNREDAKGKAWDFERYSCW
jgi:hypothetical protein